MFRQICALSLALLLTALLACAASAGGLDCDASVVDVGPLGARPEDDVYVALSRRLEMTGETVFKVFRPDEVNDDLVRHYPVKLYVGRLLVIDTQDDLLVGRMIDFASESEYPQVRYKTVMIGDCLSLEEPAEEPMQEPAPGLTGGPAGETVSTLAKETPVTVAPEELPAEVIDISGLQFPGAGAPGSGQVIPTKVLFPFDSAVVEEKWNDDLAQLAQYIAGEGPARVIVEGHACRIGPEAYNLKLSERRARAVINHLVTRHGLDRDIFEVEAYGESRPAVSNETEDGRRKNRRAAAAVLFRVIPTTRSSGAPPGGAPSVEPEELVPENTEIPRIPAAPSDVEDISKGT